MGEIECENMAEIPVESHTLRIDDMNEEWQEWELLTQGVQKMKGARIIRVMDSYGHHY